MSHTDARRCVPAQFSPRPLAGDRTAPRTPGALPPHSATRTANRVRRIAQKLQRTPRRSRACPAERENASRRTTRRGGDRLRRPSGLLPSIAFLKRRHMTLLGLLRPRTNTTSPPRRARPRPRPAAGGVGRGINYDARRTINFTLAFYPTQCCAAPISSSCAAVYKRCHHWSKRCAWTRDTVSGAS